jgi:hypothetical protein
LRNIGRNLRAEFAALLKHTKIVRQFDLRNPPDLKFSRCDFDYLIRAFLLAQICAAGSIKELGIIFNTPNNCIGTSFAKGN